VFAVIAALEDGYSLKTTLNGNSPLRDDDGKILTENQGENAGQSFGNIPLSMATQESVNTAFVDLMRQMDDGPKRVLEAAKQAGIPASVIDKQLELENGSPPLVTPLGYFPVAPIDMANAYATLAAGGKRADWYVIKKVSDYQGKTLHEHENKTTQAIPKDVVADTISAMQGVVRAGSGTNARTVCPTAGKTGTATAGADDDQHVSSSWFNGITPKLATAVMYNRGVGNEDLEGYMLPFFFGGQTPAKTFKAYMDSALDPSDCGTFPPPANIKGDKGTTYTPPPPKCGKDERLKGNKCVDKPKPTKKTPKPDPTTPAPTVPPAPEPTVPPPAPTTEPTPTPPAPVACTNPPVNNEPPGCTPV
jgi:membrane peptidoglycan carboxypeptidase